jgi:hypothetical protein
MGMISLHCPWEDYPERGEL